MTGPGIHPGGQKNSSNHSGLNIFDPNQLNKCFMFVVQFPFKHIFLILNSFPQAFSKNLVIPPSNNGNMFPSKKL